MNWIKAFGKAAESIRSEKEIVVMEIDEMHSYIGSKKTISGFGLLLIDMENDSSTSFWVKGTEQPSENFGQG